MTMDGHSYLRTHKLEAEHMLLDLGEAVTEMHGTSASGQARGSVTLVKEGGVSVVLMHLHAGRPLKEHAAPGPVTIQVLDGHVRIDVGETSLDAPSGRLVALNSGVRHNVEPLEDSTILLTVVAAA
jgi:quercetin dioxygenase-like cupin family protein